jgi:hypothetical protein
MKYIILFLLITPLSGFGQDTPLYERVPAGDINPQRLAFVTSLSDRILIAQQGGGYYQLTDREADVAMRSGLTESVQRQAYEQISSAFGEYRGLAFEEMLVPTEGTAYEIYRFRGQFGASGSGIEVRSVLNPEGKLAGFYFKPWKNKL